MMYWNKYKTEPMKDSLHVEILQRRVSFYGCVQGHWSLTFGEEMCQKFTKEILGMLPKSTRKTYTQQFFTDVKQFVVKKFLRLKQLPAAIKLLMEQPRWKLVDAFLEQVKPMYRMIQKNTKLTTKDLVKLINTTTHHVPKQVQTRFLFDGHGSIRNTQHFKMSLLHQNELLTTFPVFEEGYRNGDWGWVNGLVMMNIFAEAIHKLLGRPYASVQKNTITVATAAAIRQKKVIPKLKRFAIHQTTRDTVARQVIFELANREGSRKGLMFEEAIVQLRGISKQIQYDPDLKKRSQLEKVKMFRDAFRSRFRGRSQPPSTEQKRSVWDITSYKSHMNLNETLTRQYLKKLCAAKNVDSIRFAK